MPNPNAQLTSRIEKVKVYATGTSITRITDLKINIRWSCGCLRGRRVYTIYQHCYDADQRTDGVYTIKTFVDSELVSGDRRE